MKELPEAIASLAFRSRGGSGEYAWRREDLPDALVAISEAGYAISGGEVWLVNDGAICAGLPVAESDMMGIFGWTTQPRRTGEPWAEFCGRQLKDSLEALETGNLAELEAIARPDCLPFVWFNVTFVDRESYEARHRR